MELEKRNRGEGVKTALTLVGRKIEVRTGRGLVKRGGIAAVKRFLDQQYLKKFPPGKGDRKGVQFFV